MLERNEDLDNPRLIISSPNRHPHAVSAPTSATQSRTTCAHGHNDPSWESLQERSVRRCLSPVAVVKLSRHRPSGSLSRHIPRLLSSAVIEVMPTPTREAARRGYPPHGPTWRPGQSRPSSSPSHHEHEPVVWCTLLADLAQARPNNPTTILPCLAQQWGISSDGRTYYLRQAVRLHDDSRFTAKAVQVTFQRIMSRLEGVNSPATSLSIPSPKSTLPPTSPSVSSSPNSPQPSSPTSPSLDQLLNPVHLIDSGTDLCDTKKSIATNSCKLASCTIAGYRVKLEVTHSRMWISQESLGIHR